MNSEESKSKESEPVETKPVEEESVLNRPRPKLLLSKDKQAKARMPETIETAPKSEEPPKKEQIDVVKEHLEVIKDKTLKLFEQVTAEITGKLKTGTGLKESVKILISNSKMLIISLTSILIMLFISIFTYHYISSAFDALLSGFYSKEPVLEGFFDYVYYPLWALTKLFFHAVIISISFSIPFIISYIIVSPLNSMLSIMSLDVFNGKTVQGIDFSFEDALEDIKQSLPAAGISFALLFLAFFLNLIPVIGQIASFLIVVAMFALMLNDFSAARKNMDIKTRVTWMKNNIFHCARTGGLPAFLSILPAINNVLIAFLFPVLIIHSTLNFEQIEKSGTDLNAK